MDRVISGKMDSNFPPHELEPITDKLMAAQNGIRDIHMFTGEDGQLKYLYDTPRGVDLDNDAMGFVVRDARANNLGRLVHAGVLAPEAASATIDFILGKEERSDDDEFNDPLFNTSELALISELESDLGPEAARIGGDMILELRSRGI